MDLLDFGSHDLLDFSFERVSLCALIWPDTQAVSRQCSSNDQAEVVQLTLKENNQKTVCPDIARYPSTNAHASDLIEHKMKESILTQTVFTQFTITITIMFPFVILQWLWYICLIPMRMVTNHYTLWEENPSDSVF